MSKLDELGVNKINEKEDYVLSGRFIKNLIAQARLEEREAIKKNYNYIGMFNDIAHIYLDTTDLDEESRKIIKKRFADILNELNKN